MTLWRALTSVSLTAALAACSSGDINLSPTNVSNGGGGGGGGGSSNPCASYAVSGATRQGAYDGTNCTYDSAFVSESNPLTVNLRIPRISGVHIFADSLYVGANVESGPAPAAGTGPTLIIDAGTTLAFNASDNILINRGSRIMAEGTATQPIIFTGYEDAIAHTAGPYDSQLWAGIVINGNALTNNCDDAQRAANACHVLGEGKPSRYGGNNPTESSGVLRYIVVKHAGFDVTGLGDELNGITFNAVGSGTIVENVEIYSGFDDGIEFFGGSVNVTNYIALYVRDDSIDFSDGYNGTVRNALVIHSPQNGNNCVEGDNIAVGRIPNANPGSASSSPPQTYPTISHMTCIMSNWDTGTHGASRGVIIRFGARAIITDSVIDSGRGASENGVAPPTNVCWEIDGASTPDSINAAQAGTTTLNRTVISCQTPTTTNAQDNINGGTQTAWIMNTGGLSPFNTNNSVLSVTSFEDPLVTVLEPGTFFSFDDDNTNGQVTLRGAAGAPIVLQVPDNYIGAVQSTANWTSGWTYGFAVGARGIAPWWEQ